MIKKAWLKCRYVFVFLLFLLLILLFINWKTILFYTISSPEDDQKIELFYENYDSFISIKDFVYKSYVSKDANSYFDDEGVLFYQAHVSNLQSNELNKSIESIDQVFKEDNRWYLNRWCCDGSYVTVYTEDMSFKFVFSISGEKPTNESDLYGTWICMKSLKNNWYYFYYEYS